MDDVISFPTMQQMLRHLIELPKDEEMQYWNDHYRELSKTDRKRHMDDAEEKLSNLKLDPGFMNVYSMIPVDLQSCISMMMAAKADLNELKRNAAEKICA